MLATVYPLVAPDQLLPSAPAWLKLSSTPVEGKLPAATVAVGVKVGVEVGVLVGVRVGVAVNVAVGELVAVGVCVGVGVGLAPSGPIYVMRRDTNASK